MKGSITQEDIRRTIELAAEKRIQPVEGYIVMYGGDKYFAPVSQGMPIYRMVNTGLPHDSKCKAVWIKICEVTKRLIDRRSYPYRTPFTKIAVKEWSKKR